MQSSFLIDHGDGPRFFPEPGPPGAHSHEDHLLPLMVAAGAAPGEPGSMHLHGHAPGKPTSGLRFG